MLHITVPVPTVTPLLRGALSFEAPLRVRCDGVTLPDGSTFKPSHLGVAGFFVYRQQTATAALEVLDTSAKAWRPDPGAAVGDLVPLTAFAFEDPTWGNLLVAAAQKDAADQNLFEPASGSFPRYSFRAYFSTTHDGTSVSGLSAASLPVHLPTVLDGMRAGLASEPHQRPADATRVRLFLRNAVLAEIGKVEIRREGDSSEIEIINVADSGAARASILLTPDGDILLRPRSGRKVIVEGDVYVDGDLDVTGAIT